MQWLKDIQLILHKEPENWLNYLYGQQIRNIPHLKRVKPKFKGFVLILFKFIYFHVRNLKIKPEFIKTSNVDFFVYVGTENQITSLEQTVTSLKNRGALVVGFAERDLIKCDLRKKIYQPFCLSISDSAKSLILMMIRLPKLYRMVRNDYLSVKDWCLDGFLNTYPYLVYFHRQLKCYEPEYVVISNDHSVANRCLLAVSHYLKIKTVYLQHASISKFFPALRVNYAFLDGQCAFEVYQSCEINQPDTGREVPIPIVFFSGQKKTLISHSVEKSPVVGLALNKLDNILAAIDLVNHLNDVGYVLCVRWHPAQAQKDVQLLQRNLAGKPNVLISDPQDESVGDFLCKISWLIAGNSSIHLEAALTKVRPIYYELTPADNPDYYGYVNSGLAKLATSKDKLAKLLAEGQKCSVPEAHAVRYYSATYLTEWDGKEGELVAECLINMSKGINPPIQPFDFNMEK